MGPLVNRTRTASFIRAALAGALVAAGALIAIPLGPVPVTLQVFVVAVAALVLAPAEAGASTSAAKSARRRERQRCPRSDPAMSYPHHLRSSRGMSGQYHAVGRHSGECQDPLRGAEGVLIAGYRRITASGRWARP